MATKSLVDELIVERRIEELRESVCEVLREMIERPKVRGVAARIYIKLSECWALNLSESAGLIGISEVDLEFWRNGNTESLDVIELEKISCLLGIYRHLATLYSGHMGRAHRWLICPNDGEMFDGSSPFEFLEVGSPERFYLVRQNVASQTV